LATLKWFREIGLADRETVGGKGASLGELERAGIRVPPGFVITAQAFEAFLQAIDPQGKVRATIESLSEHDPRLAATTAEARALVESCPLPHAVRAAIDEAYAALCAGDAEAPVAVRSSATSEDSEDASFAGLQDTYLWLRGLDAVLMHVRRCWASLYSEPSVAYRRRLTLPESGVAMGVVVQRMVDARSAGVIFTRSPTTGDRSVITMEAAWGLGSAVVGGEVTPDRFTLNKVTLEVLSRTISRKTVRHIPVAAGGVVDQAVPDAEQTAPSVSDAELQELARIAKRVEQHYGRAQDIEWAIDGQLPASEAIFLLQSRPETVWSKRDAGPVATVRASAFDHLLATLSGRR
jgi:pyruvate,water dikinase